jgi:hypothetical protein
MTPIGSPAFGHALEVPVDGLGYSGCEHIDHRRPGGRTVIVTPFHAFGLHGLHHSERGW